MKIKASSKKILITTSLIDSTVDYVISKYSEEREPIGKRPELFETGNTLETRTIEDSDPDEFLIAGPTKNTFTIEDSDPDEFLVINFKIYSNSDFDEILLI